MVAIRLTDRECRDVLARALAGRLAVASRPPEVCRTSNLSACDCRRAAKARGFDASPDTGFLVLARPVPAGERIVLRGAAEAPPASVASPASPASPVSRAVLG